MTFQELRTLQRFRVSESKKSQRFLHCLFKILNWLVTFQLELSQTRRLYCSVIWLSSYSLTFYQAENCFARLLRYYQEIVVYIDPIATQSLFLRLLNLVITTLEMLYNRAWYRWTVCTDSQNRVTGYSNALWTNTNSVCRKPKYFYCTGSRNFLQSWFRKFLESWFIHKRLSHDTEDFQKTISFDCLATSEKQPIVFNSNCNRSRFNS